MIFLFLNGGPSQVDTFDPKPMLTKYNGKPMPAGNLQTERKTGNLLQSPFTFKKYGQSGIEISEIFPELGECVDDLCVIRSMYHGPAESRTVAVPDELRREAAGPAVHGIVAHLRAGHGEPESAGLRRALSGTAGGGPAALELDLPARGLSGHLHQHRGEGAGQADPVHSQQEFDARAAARRTRSAGEAEPRHMAQQGGDPQLEACIQSAEIAFRMQTEAPDAFDITQGNGGDARALRRQRFRPRLPDGAPRWSSAACAWCRCTSATASPGTTTTTS